MAAIAGELGGDPRVAPQVADGLLQRLIGPPDEPRESWVGGGGCLVAAGGNASNLRVPEARVKIVADARLDDRVGLARALGLDPKLPDVALILAAYEQWGVDCAQHLLGDFAFAIWNPRTRSLFCARDPFGVKPLYYRRDGERFAFASRLDAIGHAGDVVDRGRVAAFLAGIDDDATDTALEAVRRLPMGHWLLWSAERLRLERYSVIEAEVVSPGEDFATGFRDRFLAAVDARADEAVLGAFLSGGLDSSSIASAVGQHRVGTPLRTFSFSYPRSPSLDESGYAAAVIARYRVVADFVDMDDLAPLNGLADLAEGGDDLFFAPGLPKITQLLARARRSGVRVVLDGHGGDEVVSFGYGRLTELARRRRWATLYRELRGAAAESGQGPGRMLLDAMLSTGAVGRVRSRFGRRTARAVPADPAEILDPDFAAETDIGERVAQWTSRYRRAAATESSLHLWNVTAPGVARAFETLRRAGDQMGVELRFPFYDQRLVRYALAVPDDQKLKDGWSRSILRRAMADILPDKVRWRRGKVDFRAELSGGLLRHHRELLDEVLRDGAPVAEYVDLAAIRGIVADLGTNKNSGSPELFALWRVVLLALWLGNRSAALQPARVLS